MGAPSIPSDYDFGDPETNIGPRTITVCYALLAISILVIGARIAAKCRTTRRLYWDDWLMVVALVFGIVHAALVHVGVENGLGRHYLYLNDYEKEWSVRWGLLCLIWGFTSPMAARVSYCITLLFLSGTDPLVKKWPTWVFIALQIIFNLGAVVICCVQCGLHLDILWKPEKMPMWDEYCWDPVVQRDYVYFLGAFNTLTDVFLAVLPAMLIIHTTWPLKTKIGLGLVLCLSILAMIGSIVKTYETKNLSQIIDFSYVICPYIIWLSVELNLVMIVASVPLLRPLFRRTTPHPQSRWESITLGSVLPKSRGSGRSRPSSSASEEFIMASAESQKAASSSTASAVPAREREGLAAEQGITRTMEVSVTYESSNAPFVHAALVGLVQGEIQNPGIARR
ncbi:hypothetical protein MBLNU230_g5252t1 [Neophaeotheca triangularis]